MDSVNYPTRILLLIAAFLATGMLQANTDGSVPSLNIAGVNEQNINGIRFISPVTDANYAQVMQRLREQMKLRPLSATESNRLLADIVPGSYFYAYGFQLAKSWNETGDFLVSAKSGSPWYQYELHKLPDGSINLLGLTTLVDVEKFEFYSKTYGPTPKLKTQPVGDYNILIVLPYDMLGKIAYTEIPVEKGAVSTIDAAVFPISE